MQSQAALTAKVGRVFTKVMAGLEPDLTISLLKPSETSRDYITLLTITSKRFFEYSNFRKNFLLEIADESEQLTEAIGEATHVLVDDDLYVISKGDTSPPKSTDVTWKIYCDLYQKRSVFAGLR
jgi:hypothetical protein